MNSESLHSVDSAEVASAPTSPARRYSQVVAVGAGWRRPFLLAFAIAAGMRLLLSAWAALMLALSPATGLQAQYAPVGVPLQTSGLAAPWQREDALWYEKIATQGYSPTDGTSVFPPLLPALMRLASMLTLGNVALAGLLVGSLASVVTLALLYRLAALDTGANAAFLSVVYLAIFPTAFFLYSAFTESLFLMLALGAFWHARAGRWLLVTILAALTTLARVQGALLFLPLAVEYMAWAKWDSVLLKRRILQFGSVVVAAPLSALAFFAFRTYMVGDTLSWTDRQIAIWGHRVTWPVDTLLLSSQKAIEGGAASINRFDLAVLLLFTLLTIASFRLRWSYGLYGVTLLIPTLLHTNDNFPLMSMSRYVLAAFPCFIVLAIWSAKRPLIVRLLVAAISLSLLLFWSAQFVHGHWVA